LKVDAFEGEIPTSYVVVFCVQWVQLRWELIVCQWVQLRWEVIVCFVDIGEIDDHPYLNFLLVEKEKEHDVIYLPLSGSRNCWFKIIIDEFLDRHKNVAELNQLMRSQPFLLWISTLNWHAIEKKSYYREWDRE
jgi:hypothetical protein